METITTVNKNGSFLMQKFYTEEDKQLTEQNCQTDKFKILELSNFIDSWEQELLFGNNGFFSFKGKDVQNKSKEFVFELNELINSKINEIKFDDEVSKKLAAKIKTDKISSISAKMTIYENSELLNWQLSVCDNALQSAITRAVLYKNDEETVITSYKNGLSVLSLMAEKEGWSDKIYNKKEKSFKSEFYYSLINAYIKDRDINAYKYFEKYKDCLILENIEDVQNSIDLLKTEIISYNWAREVFSYKLKEEEQTKELNKIKDEKIKNRAKTLLKEFAVVEKREQAQKEKDDNEKNWQEIISAVKEDINNAALFIDYTLKDSHISAAKKYIKKIKTTGYIESDKKEFVTLFKEMTEDFLAYKNKDISAFRADLSDEDFDIFNEFSAMKNSEQFMFSADYKYALNKINKKLSNEEAYDLIKLFICSVNESKTEKNKKPDLQERRKIIDSVLAQFTNKKEGENK